MSGQSLAPNWRGRRATNLWAGSARFFVADMKAIELTAFDYAAGIARALREDFAGASMVKEICEATGASVGIVKKWLAEENGPGGEYLIKLMAASPSVRAFVDKVTRRNDAAAEAEDRLRRALAIMEGRDEGQGEVIEIVPALEAELELERRPPAPSKRPTPFKSRRLARRYA